jgi:uncharacterized protein (DUF1697 family)
MQSFRERMEELGFTDVESYGMSGNLLFSAAGTAALERRIAARLGTAAFVRSIRALATIVPSDPFRSSILFLGRAPTAARRQRFLQTDFDEPRACPPR